MLQQQRLQQATRSLSPPPHCGMDCSGGGAAAAAAAAAAAGGCDM